MEKKTMQGVLNPLLESMESINEINKQTTYKTLPRRPNIMSLLFVISKGTGWYIPLSKQCGPSKTHLQYSLEKMIKDTDRV